MAQDQTNEKDQVLIARNNETGETGAVKGLKQDGTPDMAPSKSAKLSDLVVFNIHKNPLEAFLSNFVRQCKNPSMFSFFKVDADNVNSVGQVVEDALKDPEANKAMLSEAKVEVKAANRNSHAIDESKIDWQGLKDRWGIDREMLEKSGDLKEMLYNRKSRLVTITPTFAGEKYSLEARLSFREDANGNIKVVPHFIRKEPNLDQEFNGVKFTDEDKQNLRTTGNLGRLADVVDKETGEVIPSFISIDRQTNEILSVPAKSVFVKDTIGQTKLDMGEINTLKSGKAITDKEIVDRKGNKYTVTLQVSADRRDVEFVPSYASQKQAQSESNGQKKSTWLTQDGKIKPITKWAGVPMTEKQQADYVAGKTVVLDNMVDKEGKPCTVYLTFNMNKQRPTTSFKDPRQAESITPANEAAPRWLSTTTERPTRRLRKSRSLSTEDRPVRRTRTNRRNQRGARCDLPHSPVHFIQHPKLKTTVK